jgi:hypothetical protein
VLGVAGLPWVPLAPPRQAVICQQLPKTEALGEGKESAGSRVGFWELSHRVSNPTQGLLLFSLGLQRSTGLECGGAPCRWKG